MSTVSPPEASLIPPQGPEPYRLTVAQYVERGGGSLGADDVGRGIVDLVTDDARDAPAYLITRSGLAPLE